MCIRYDLALRILSKEMGPFIDASTTSQEYEKNINVILKRLRHSHLSSVIFWYTNINSIRNKIVDLNKIVDRNIDNLRIAETKLEESFPNNQFVYQYNQDIYTRYYRKQRWLDGIC